MTELFGKDFAKQKRSPIEIMLKDAENRMRKVNPNQLYAKFRAGAKKTFPIIKQIAITAFRQLKKVLPSILKDAWTGIKAGAKLARSEEHTSELQSRQYLVCRLLLEKKKNTLSLSIIVITI